MITSLAAAGNGAETDRGALTAARLRVRFPRLGVALSVTLALTSLICGSCGGGSKISFEVVGTTVHMSGEIDQAMRRDFIRMADSHQNADTISMIEVTGSMNDEVNLDAADLITGLGFSTHVPADGVITGGAINLFLAGRGRSYDKGAQFGLLSWAPIDGVEAAELPGDHPAHQPPLDFYFGNDIDDSFYWFTLEAATSNTLHWMTPAELDTYGFATPPG